MFVDDGVYIVPQGAGLRPGQRCRFYCSGWCFSCQRRGSIGFQSLARRKDAKRLQHVALTVNITSEIADEARRSTHQTQTYVVKIRPALCLTPTIGPSQQALEGILDRANLKILITKDLFSLSDPVILQTSPSHQAELPIASVRRRSLASLAPSCADLMSGEVVRSCTGAETAIIQSSCSRLHPPPNGPRKEEAPPASLITFPTVARNCM